MKELLSNLKNSLKAQDYLAIGGLELGHNLLVLTTAGLIAYLINGVFLENLVITEAASLLGVLLLTMLAKNLLTYLETRKLSQISESVQNHYRKLVEASIFTQDHDDRTSLMTLALESVHRLDEFFQKVAPLILTGSVRFPLFLVFIAYLDIYSALIFLITLPIAPFLLYLLGKVTNNASQKEWLKQNELNTTFYELIEGMVTLKIFRQSKTAIKDIKTLSQEFATSTLNVLKVAFLSAFATELITTLSIAIVAVTIGLRMVDDQISFFVGFWILLIAPEFFQPLRQSGIAFHTGMNTTSIIAEIKAIIAADTTTPTGTHTEQILLPPEITVTNLTFRYPTTFTPSLANFSAKFAAGKVNVITGDSGAGKTTLLSLVGGLRTADEGEILVGGLDVRKIHSYSRLMSYVPQEPHLFAMTLRDNLQLKSDYTDERLQEVLATVGLSSWYNSLAAGLDTRLGDGGAKVSNGERHRLGLARAILKNPSILLLDEVTAGLEETEEQELLQTLEPIFYRKTVIIVSHRRQVIERADNLIRVEKIA